MQNCRQVRALIEHLMRERSVIEERVPRTGDRRQRQRSFEVEPRRRERVSEVMKNRSEIVERRPKSPERGEEVKSEVVTPR